MKRKQQSGFTLVELMVVAAILIFTFMGILWTYLQCLELNEMSRISSRALFAVKNRMEEIVNTPIDDIIAEYHNATFSIQDLNGIGVSVIDDTDPNLMKITASFCWEQRSGRVVGEDQNLNGILDDGEDSNQDGIVSSPVQLVTYLKRG